MECSSPRLLELKKLADIRNRIKYYLGPLYYEDKVYVNNLIGIDDCQSHEFKNMLVKYGFQDKKFILHIGDISHIMDKYCLVKNRFSGQSCIFLNTRFYKYFLFIHNDRS